jgi:hypothetical protein
MNGIYLPHSALEFSWRRRGRNKRESERWGGVSSKQRPKQLHTEHHDDDDI